MLGSRNVRLAIIGNKVDLLNVGASEQRAAAASSVVREAIQLVDELQNARHFLTSAKLNQGIGELFVSLARHMIDQHRRLSSSSKKTTREPGGDRFARHISLSEPTNDQQEAEQQKTNSCAC